MINERFNKTMQKLNAKLSNVWKRGPKQPVCFPPLKSIPDYMYENFSFQEVIILLHLPYAIKQRFSI